MVCWRACSRPVVLVPVLGVAGVDTRLVGATMAQKASMDLGTAHVLQVAHSGLEPYTAWGVEGPWSWGLAGDATAEPEGLLELMVPDELTIREAGLLYSLE